MLSAGKMHISIIRCTLLITNRIAGPFLYKNITAMTFFPQIPSWFGDERQEPTSCNPFPLPEIYGAFQSKKVH